jgi:hypothetical protein
MMTPMTKACTSWKATTDHSRQWKRIEIEEEGGERREEEGGGRREERGGREEGGTCRNIVPTMTPMTKACTSWKATTGPLAPIEEEREGTMRVEGGGRRR